MRVEVVAIVLACAAGVARGADAGNLIGIHFWGDREDGTPAGMLDSVNRGAWDVEVVNTANLQYGGWKDEDVVDPLYQKFRGEYHVTPITRLGYYWGQTLPAPGTAEYAGWASYIANEVVGRMKDTAHIWQMGNEPNLRGEATNWVNQEITPGEYAALYRTVRSAVHAPGLLGAAGGQQLLVAPPSPGGVAGDRWMDGNQWLDGVLGNIPAGEVDGVALHAYGGGADGNASLISFHQALVEQLAVIDGRGLTGVPVYLTEWNRYTPVGDAGEEAVTADFVRKAAAFLDRWNRTPGNHNVVGTGWFVYDGTADGSGAWDGYSIEYWKAHGNPAGSEGDLYTAFAQVARAGYRAGVVGSRPMPASVRMIDDFETGDGHFTWSPTQSGTTTGASGASFKVRNDEDSYTKGFSQKIGIVDAAAAGGWYVRYVSNGGSPAGSAAINLTSGTDGSVGFFLRVYTVGGVQATEVANPPGMRVGIAMDVGASGGRTEQGVWRDVVADGEWHFYEWDLDALGDWTQWRSASGGVLNNSTGVFPTAGQVTLDSILLAGGDFDAEFLLDSVMVNSAGSLSVMDYVPEPGAVSWLYGGAGVLLCRRRTGSVGGRWRRG